MESSLRRYTELPYVIDFLQTKKLALLSPASWDDRNDSYYIEKYAQIKGLKSVYALCLAEAPETYHHWRVFSHGSGGACIEFDKALLAKNAQKIAGLRAEEVKYETTKNLRSIKLNTQELPFLKRYAFIDEKEFRLFIGSNENGAPVYRLPLPLNTIKRITLSPWLPKSVVKEVKKTLNAIDGCKSLKIYRSTLVENEDWKKLADKVA